MTCGDVLRRYRRLAGLTQDELGARCGYSGEYIRKLESGRRRPPRAALDRIADVLSLGVQERHDLLTARSESGDPDPVSTKLAGRTAELVAIRHFLAGHGPPALLFSGEPGLGKTRLLDEAALLAAQVGWRVVRGGCQRRDRDPYAPLSAALADSLRHLPASEQQSALRRADRLGLLLPEYAQPVDGAPPSVLGAGTAEPPLRADQDRRMLFAAVAEYLGAVARESGVVLILDDLQWAGPDALDLLGSLILPTGGAPTRIIGAYRDSEAPAAAPFAEFVADLARAFQVQVLGLEPLAEDEARALLRAVLPESDAARRALPAILRRAGGVPFFLVSFVENLRDERGEGPEMALPWTVAQVIQQRVGALPEAVREVLGSLAVMGREATPELLAAVTGRGEEDVLGALDAAVAARLVWENGPPGYGFRHDLIRDAVEQGLLPGQRRLLHRRIGAALEHLPLPRREERAAELAWHFHRGGDAARALPWLLRAGDAAAARFAPQDAERHYCQAAELARELGDEPGEARALERVGDLRYRLGRYGDAIEPLEQAETLYAKRGDRDGALRAVARAGDAYRFAGRAAEGITKVWAALRARPEGEPSPRSEGDPELQPEKASQQWPAGEPPEGLAGEPGERPTAGLADLYAALCSLYLFAGRAHDALQAARTAISLAEVTGNQWAACNAEIVHGLVLGLLQRREEQRRAYERAAQIGEALGSPWLLALAIYQIGLWHLAADDGARGERQIRRALEIGERAALLGWTNHIRAGLSALLVARGRWAEARAEAERAEAESRTLGPRPGATFPLVALGRILLLQGEREEGQCRLYEALEMAQTYAYPAGLLVAHEALAWHALREGRPGEAVERLEPLLERGHVPGQPLSPGIYAWALLELGHDERAAEALARARERALGQPARPELPGLLLRTATLAARQGRRDEAAQALEEGLAIARELELPYDEALLLEEDARIRVAWGEPDEARRHLTESLELLRRLGARPDAERVARMLDALTRPVS